MQASDGDHLIANCVFRGNQANAAGVCLVYDGQAAFINCTCVNNTAAWRGSAFWARRDSRVTIANCILWNDVASVPAIYVEPGNTLSIHHTDIRDAEAGIDRASGSTVDWGTGNIDADPRLRGPGEAELQLAADSLCLDAGDNDALPPDVLDLDADLDTAEPLPVDRRGLLRVVAGTVGPAAPLTDMGAYEYQDDCNNNHTADSIDLAGGASRDCNDNLVPDECDPDADRDGVADSCDNCTRVGNPGQEDTDGDLFGDACDNCDLVSNPDQANLDADILGDACDNDIDGDGFLNAEDNCPAAINLQQEDADVDGRGDACDLCANTIGGITVDETGCPPDFLGDMDRDGDVDQSDFGAFQVCLSGTNIPQNDPACQRARLDTTDPDVDPADMAIFRDCVSGTNVPPTNGCRRGG